MVLVAGCSAEHRAAVHYAVEQSKAAYDTEASVLLQGPCAMNVGSYWRVLNKQQREAVDNLCGK
jgi:hypothetical protein